MFGEFRGVLARKADAFGYPFQLTRFSFPISGPLKDSIFSPSLADEVIGALPGGTAGNAAAAFRTQIQDVCFDLRNCSVCQLLLCVLCVCMFIVVYVFVCDIVSLIDLT